MPDTTNLTNTPSGRRLPARPRVAVVGATGVVGRVMLDLLQERKFPAASVLALATERSAGTRLAFGDGELAVEEVSRGAFEGIDLALLDTPDEAALEWAPAAVAAGAIVVDNSAAWRMHDDVPLVVPEVNPEALSGHKGIVASPNCTTTGVILGLAPLHRRFGLQEVVVSSYQATSGAGSAGVAELAEQSSKLADQIAGLGTAEAARIAPPAAVFPAAIAFNVVPQAGSFAADGYTSEERKLWHETRKILDLADLEVTATCVRVPTVVGHGASVLARFSQPVDLEEALDALRSAPGVELADLPTAHMAAGKDPSFIGRVRRDQSDPNRLWFFCACDNLRKGAALNAVQIAESLLSSA